MSHSCADDPGALLAPGEAYHVIELSGCDFLIAVTEDGRLDLNDVFVEDFDQDMSARPEVRITLVLVCSWGLPHGPQHGPVCTAAQQDVPCTA